MSEKLVRMAMIPFPSFQMIPSLSKKVGSSLPTLEVGSQQSAVSSQQLKLAVSS
jgi:hypothetical protein